jgi:D-glycero-D-manno-heptose 1,7-bisphosphate phosphatase
MSNKAIFLDRDDTLIEDAGYINNPDQVKLLDGVGEAMRELKDMGYKLVVATNQSGVARGIVTEEVLGEIHNRLKQLLAENDAFLDQIYYCPYHPEGVIPKYRKESDWRKPNPGMLLSAAEEMDIDLGQSWCIGNSSRDVEAGLRAGCKTILINPPWHKRQPQSGEATADYQAVNIKEAVNIIKRYHRTPIETATKEAASFAEEAEAAANAGETETVLESIETPAQIAEPVSELAEAVLEPAEPKQQPLEAVEDSIEQLSQAEQPEQQAEVSEQQEDTDTTSQLLNAILEQLKKMQRTEMFGAEFSITRLMAGVVQGGALFCLLITVWLLMSPTRQVSSIQIALGFAVVLQMMALTFYVMQSRK